MLMKFFTNSTTLPLFPYIAEVGGGPNKSPQRSAALDVVGQKLFGPVFLASRLLLLLIFFTGLAGRASAQFLVAYPNPAQDVSMCVNSTLLTVRVDVVNTSTGTTVAVDLPPGVTYTPGTVAQTGGTIVGITESNITNLNIPVFSIGDVGVGQFIAFTIQRTASDCAARAYVLGGGVMKDVVTVSGSAGSTTESNPTVNTYNLLYPALAITPPPPTINALRGGIYTRSGTATNGGTGCANAVHFFIVYPSGKIQNVGNKVTVGGVDFPASGTNGDTLFFELTGSIFGGDNLLCNGESFTYTVTEKILDCSMGAASLTPQYNAAWGCPGPSRCQTASATAPYTMQNGVPATSVTFAIITPEAGCTPGTHDATITNTGSGGQAGALYGILTNFLEGSNSSVAFSLSNFRIGAIPLTAVGIVGTLHSKSIDFSQLTTDPDGMGVGLEDIDGDGQYDDLMPGQSFTVRFDRSYIVQPLCVYGYAQLVSVQPTYFSMCGATRVAPSATTHTASYFFSSSGAISLLTPPSVTPGTPFTLQICRNGNSNPPTTRVTDSTEIILVLPPDLAYVPGTAFVQKTTGTGTMEVSQSGNILTLYTKGVNTIACYTFDLVYTCGAGGTLSIPYTFQYVLDRACNAVEQYRCSNITTLTSCPAPCTILGPSIGSVNIQRTTLGWTDGTLATKISPASMTTLSKKTVMPLDSFRVTTSARINAPAGGYDNLYFEYRLGRPLANQNAVEFRYGTVRFKPAGSPTVTATCTLPVISYAASTSTLEVMRFDFSSLLGSCLPATLMTGDSVFLDATFQVMAVGAPTGTLFGYTRIQAPNSYMEFYNLDAMGNRLVCVGAIPDLLFLGLTLAIGSESVNATGCGTRGTGTTVNLQFDEINNPFPTEFRPSLHEDSIIITLPTGFAFDMTQPFRYFYGRWTNPIVHSRLPVTIPPAMITQLAPNKIKIDNTANLLPYNQLGSQFGVAAVYHNIVPTCNAPSAALTPLHQAYQDWFYYSDAPVSGLRQNIQVSTWSYNSATKPALTLQNLTGTVQGVSPVQQWTVRISNPSPQTAPYVWLAIEDAPNGSGIDVVSVMDGATPLTPISYANGKWYQVSAAGLASGATKDLVINFTYAGCLPQQINAMTGWDCPGFPANPTAYMCGAPTMTVPLGVDPQPSEIQLTLDQQPAAPVTACTPFQYLLTINSAQAANLTNTKFGINLPTGLVMSGALEAEYPKGSGNWQVIANSGTATNLLFDLSTHAQYPSSGLPGTVLSPGTANRQICLRFNVETTCAFSPGNIFDFTVYADRPCGGAAIGNGVITTSSAINIAGITAPYLTGSVNNAPSPVVGCGVEQIINVITTIVGGTTGANDHIVVTFPTGTTYTGTFNCSGGNCPTVVGYSGNVLTLSIPTGVGAGTSIAYGFGIAGSGYAGCGAARKLRIQTTTELVGPTCNGVPCGNVSANTGSLDIDLDISKPSFTMSGFTATAQVPISGTTIMYQTNIQTITNTSATANAPAGTILEFFCLDGSGNPLGTPIGTAVLPAVPAGGTTSVMTNFSASCSLTNGIGVVIQDVTDPAAPAPGTPNMVQCLCAESARLAASLLNCFAIANGNPATQTVCQGTSPSAVTFATQNAVTNGIRFVGFAAPTADPYTGGTNLGTATGNGTDVTLSTAMMPTAVGTHYIYAIQDPVPSDPTCRPAGLAQLTINPAATVTAGSPQSICAGGTVTLAGTLGGAATSAVWSAPSGSFGNANSLTSTYMPSITSGSVMLTLTTDDPAGVCPAATSTVVITINAVPDLSANNVTNVCPATTVDLTDAGFTGLADANNTTGTLTYHSTLAGASNPTNNTTAVLPSPATAAVPGTYYIRKTTANGCFDYVQIAVTETLCPCTTQPMVQITETNVNTCSTNAALFNYTVAYGPTTTFLHNGGGTLSVAQLPNGTGTFTYTPVAGDIGNTVTITAGIADPDGYRLCTSASDVATVTVNACAACDITVSSATPSLCGNNVYDLSVVVTYTNPPGGSSIVVATSGGATVSLPQTTSPQVITLTGLTSNGVQDINVSAHFTTTPVCTDTLNAAYDAPASCAGCGTPKNGTISIIKN